jgi:hypothetical protein
MRLLIVSQKSLTSAILKIAKLTLSRHTLQQKALFQQQLRLYVFMLLAHVQFSQSLPQEESSKITTQATGATSWRRGDVKYKKNEAFVDVVEVVNLSMSAKG